MPVDNKKDDDTLDTPQSRQMRKACFKCHMPTYPIFLCKCGGGGGGGGSGGGEEGLELGGALPQGGGTVMFDDASGQVAELKPTLKPIFSDPSAQLRKDKPFDLDVIMQLIAQGLLHIENNLTTGILTIKCNPDLLSEKQKLEVTKFIRTIEMECNQFKQGIALVGLDAKGNVASLTVDLRKDLPLYAKLIQYLLKNNLLPLLDGQQAQKEEERRFNPSPFSMRMKPPGFQS